MVVVRAGRRGRWGDGPWQMCSSSSWAGVGGTAKCWKKRPPPLRPCLGKTKQVGCGSLQAEPIAERLTTRDGGTGVRGCGCANQSTKHHWIWPVGCMHAEGRMHLSRQGVGDELGWTPHSFCSALLRLPAVPIPSAFFDPGCLAHQRPDQTRQEQNCRLNNPYQHRPQYHQAPALSGTHLPQATGLSPSAVSPRLSRSPPAILPPSVGRAQAT